MNALRRDYRYLAEQPADDPPADAPPKPPQAVYTLTPAGKLWVPYLLIATVVIGLLIGWGYADAVRAGVAP